MEVTGAPFPDVPVDAWYAEAVAGMKDSGIIMGCDDGLFHPEREVTQGEFYAMLLRALTYPGANIGGGNTGPHWASGIMQTAHYAGFDNQWKEGGHEDDPVTRSEAVSRVAEAHHEASVANKSFADRWAWTVLRGGRTILWDMSWEAIPDHAAIEAHLAALPYGTEDRWILNAYVIGICQGVDEAGNFAPTKTLTRAEIAQLLYNALFTNRYSSLGGARYSIGGKTKYNFDSRENYIA